MSANGPAIFQAIPPVGIPGGEVTLRCRGFVPGLPSESMVLCGDAAAAIVSASEDKVIVRLPESPAALGLTLRVGSQASPVYPFQLGRRLADGLHPVTNPVVAPDGTIITTVSGRRGERTDHPLVLISRSGEKSPCSCEIMNPTGLAFGPDGQLYVSSRHDGTVVRLRDFENPEVVAEDLGIASGLAFDSRGILYVGDRTGRILRIDSAGKHEELVRLEPSVSAYHMAMDGEDRLYVTGPTLAMCDSVYRVSGAGHAEVFWRGLARPQGLAVTPRGEVLVAAAYGGKKGIFRLSARGEPPHHLIAAPMLVGLALWRDEFILADGSAIYRVTAAGGSAPVV